MTPHEMAVQLLDRLGIDGTDGRRLTHAEAVDVVAAAIRGALGANRQALAKERERYDALTAEVEILRAQLESQRAESRNLSELLSRYRETT